MERRHGFEDRYEGGERDERGDEHVYQYRGCGRVGSLEQVVQLAAPRGLDGFRHWRAGAAMVTWMSMKGPGFLVSVSISIRLFRFVLSGLFVVVIGGCVTAYRRLISGYDIVVVCMSVVVEEG